MEYGMNINYDYPLKPYFPPRSYPLPKGVNLPYHKRVIWDILNDSLWIFKKSKTIKAKIKIIKGNPTLVISKK